MHNILNLIIPMGALGVIGVSLMPPRNCMLQSVWLVLGIPKSWSESSIMVSVMCIEGLILFYVLDDGLGGALWLVGVVEVK